ILLRWGVPLLETKKALITFEEAGGWGRLMGLGVFRKVETGLLRPIARTELNKAPRKGFSCS
ncbi:citrate lyase holo-[acyl-carrier protein] synthase, partial [Streptococcus thoraltensis]